MVRAEQRVANERARDETLDELARIHGGVAVSAPDDRTGTHTVRAQDGTGCEYVVGRDGAIIHVCTRNAS